jgi:26S proteasome regulatory subunit N1
MRSAIKEATASMTSVPKPLKFLRGHYGTLKETFETVKSGDNRCAPCGCAFSVAAFQH